MGDLDKAAMADGSIPVKYKELLTVAMAHSNQCPCCEDIHTPNAHKQGAGDAELVEEVIVSGALRASEPITYESHGITKRRNT